MNASKLPVCVGALRRFDVRLTAVGVESEGEGEVAADWAGGSGVSELGSEEETDSEGGGGTGG